MVASDIVLCVVDWSDKTKFPAALRPVVTSIALKALALDEYDEHFFNLMPLIFPYNRFTMSVRPTTTTTCIGDF